MGEIRQPAPCLLVLAAFSAHREAIDWARRRAAESWGPVALESPRFAFAFTSYYDRTMGTGLKKVFWGFEPLIDPGQLAALKLQSNRWEDEYAAQSQHDVPRPLNLDPGYVTEAKLVLATTKDRDHRLYLERGIFAEVTLCYRRGSWCANPWTYPDYQSPQYHAFFHECRQYLRSRSGGRTGPAAGP